MAELEPRRAMAGLVIDREQTLLSLRVGPTVLQLSYPEAMRLKDVLEHMRPLTSPQPVYARFDLTEEV